MTTKMTKKKVNNTTTLLTTEKRIGYVDLLPKEFTSKEKTTKFDFGGTELTTVTNLREAKQQLKEAQSMFDGKARLYEVVLREIK